MSKVWWWYQANFGGSSGAKGKYVKNLFPVTSGLRRSFPVTSGRPQKCDKSGWYHFGNGFHQKYSFPNSFRHIHLRFAQMNVAAPLEKIPKGTGNQWYSVAFLGLEYYVQCNKCCISVCCICLKVVPKEVLKSRTTWLARRIASKVMCRSIMLSTALSSGQ